MAKENENANKTQEVENENKNVNTPAKKEKKRFAWGAAIGGLATGAALGAGITYFIMR